MPEGDTVYRTARSLHNALAGEKLTATDFRVPQLATADLSGQTIQTVVSRGKHLLARTSEQLTLHTHLKMEGRWELYRPASPWSGGPAHEVRAVLRTEAWVAVGFRLGILELIPTEREDEVVGHLGPDLLGSDWDLEEAIRRIEAAPARPVAEALLDQRNLAGIGNLYKNEVLFVTGVDPWMPVRDIPSLSRIVETARKMLELNKGHWSQTTTGNTRKGQRHWVFERAGHPCRRCGAPIESAEQGEPGLERLTYWCPNCQGRRNRRS